MFFRHGREVFQFPLFAGHADAVRIIVQTAGQFIDLRGILDQAFRQRRHPVLQLDRVQPVGGVTNGLAGTGQLVVKNRSVAFCSSEMRASSISVWFKA